MTLSTSERIDRKVIRRCVLLITILVVIWALQRFQGFLVPTMIGLFLALVLTPIVHEMEVRGFPRVIAAGLVVLTVLISFGSVIYAVLPSYENYLDRAPEIVRDIERKLAPIREKAEEAGLIGGRKPVQETPELQPGARAAVPVEPDPEGDDVELPVPGRSFYTDVALNAPALFGNFLYIVFLTFFTIYDRRRLMRFALATQRTFGARAWIYRVIRDMRTKVASYLMAVTIINSVLGIVTGLVFWALGMPNPILWGAGMAVLNFIPYLGPAVMNVIVFAVAFVHYPTVFLAFIPVACLLILNLLEGQFVTPMVIGSRVATGSLPVFLAVAFGAWLWGPAGALLATPALIVGQTLMTARVTARRTPDREAKPVS